MLAVPVLNAKEARAVVESLQPDLLVDGHAPETRVVFSGLTWERYLAWDKALGDDRPGPRFYYLDGELEIMSTSENHECIKKWLADCLTIYFDEIGIDVVPRGQATMRLELKQAGAEPDESWCLHKGKRFPDIVLEIALTSGGIRKLEVYQRFAVPEVWIWRRGGLEVHALNTDGSGYEQVPTSGQLPGLDKRLLERCAKIPSWSEARRAFRAGLTVGK